MIFVFSRVVPVRESDSHTRYRLAELVDNPHVPNGTVEGLEGYERQPNGTEYED